MPRPISQAKIDCLKKLNQRSAYAYNNSYGKWKIDGTTQAISDWLIKNELVHTFPVDGSQGYFCRHVFLTDKGKELLNSICPETE